MKNYVTTVLTKNIKKNAPDLAANKICDYGSIYDSKYRIDGFKKGANWAIQEINRIFLRHGNR